MNNQNKLIFKNIFLGIALIILVISIYLYSKQEKNEQEKNEINEDDNISISEPVGAVVDLSAYNLLDEWAYKVYRESFNVKGIYVTANTAGIEDKLQKLIQLANNTEINAFVIDVKNDNGNVTYDMNVPLVDEIGSEEKAIRNINHVMDELYKNKIYPIARIVAFKDPYLSSHQTDYAIKNKDGTLFVYKKVSWLNPYNEGTWDYVLDIAKQAALSGFKEIQFDYIRFEATRSLENADFGVPDSGEARMTVITQFIEYAQKQLEPYDVKVSADVFGTIISSEVDAKMIGQNYIEMAKKLDIICPMVYPSHYGRGYFGLPASEPPDYHPYEIIYGSMMESEKQLMVLTSDQHKPIIRPWLQAFTASYLPKNEYMTYDGVAIRKQIQAVTDVGLEEWILWNSGNRYGEGLEAE